VSIDLHRMNQQLPDVADGTLKFIEITKPHMVGDAWAAKGAVIAITPHPVDENGQTIKLTIYPVVPVLLEDRARDMCQGGTPHYPFPVAKPSKGPATLEIGNSLDLSKILEGLGVSSSPTELGGKGLAEAPTKQGAHSPVGAL
jgi:hypothetical protein